MVAMFENFISVTQEEDVPQVGPTLGPSFLYKCREPEVQSCFYVEIKT